MIAVKKSERIHAAFQAGDLAELEAALDDPRVIPNGSLPFGMGTCLEYAIYHSPLGFIQELLELGADPNADDQAGFPPLIATLHSATRPETLTILDLLLAHGADPDQRGINDYTALHVAVTAGNQGAVERLLEGGADPTRRTRIDDLETPWELAESLGLAAIAALLMEWEEGPRSGPWTSEPENPL